MIEESVDEVESVPRLLSRSLHDAGSGFSPPV